VDTTLFTRFDCRVQKRSKFENFAQFTSWFLTSVFHGGGRLSNNVVESKLRSP